MNAETIGHYFLDAAARHPERLLIRKPNRTLSYGDVAIVVACTIARLREEGIVRGDRVACYLEDQVGNLMFELACAIAGVVAVPLSPLFSVEYFLDGIVGPTGARAVFTTQQNAAAFAGRGLRLFAYRDPYEPAAASDLQFFDEEGITLDDAIETLGIEAAANSGDDVFVIQPTSGSTGRPKLVLRRHRAFTRYAHFVGAQLVMPHPDAPLSFLMTATLTHAFGLHMLTTALRRGATLCVPSALDTAASLAEIRQLDPVVLPILPRMQRALLRQHERDFADDERIFGPAARYACSAGGVADAELLERIRRSGIDIIEFYGSSEASVIALTHRGDWRPGWSGFVAPDAEVRVNPDGELAVRSPGVMPGYLDDAAANAAVFTADGFYLTGDLGEVTGERRLRILGRKRDVFNTPEGSNIYPGAIEQQIESLPLVEAAVLVGDQKPFIAAILVLRQLPPEADGRCLLDPIEFRTLYEAVGATLSRVNAGLERIEKIIRFAILGGPFVTEVYRVVGPGKIRRDRPALATHYADVIESIYSRTQLPEPSFVPGTERRLRPAERY